MTNQTDDADSVIMASDEPDLASVAEGDDAIALEEMQAGQDALEDDDPSLQSKTAADLEAVFDVPVRVSAVLGHSRMRSPSS